MPMKMISKYFAEKAARAAVDRDFYLQNYPDVSAVGMDPIEHFMDHGWLEGRNPSPDFCTLFYKDKFLSDFPNVNPLVHYHGLRKSKISKLSISTKPRTLEDYLSLQYDIIAPHFDKEFYSATYDLEKHIDPIRHYLDIGWVRSFKPRKDFDPLDYVNNNFYVKRLIIPPFYHYITSKISNNLPSVTVSDGYPPKISAPAAQTENSSAEAYSLISRAFDSDYYITVYHDVRENKNDPLEHYMKYGWIEGRNPNELFSHEYYTSVYSYAIPPGMNPFLHYLTVGKKKNYRQNPYGNTLIDISIAPPLNAWDHLSSHNDIERSDIVVIMPVFRGYNETLAAIYSVLSAPQITRYSLLVINDAGPDDDLNEQLQLLADRQLFCYKKLEKNLGFVRSVNYGLEVADSKDVILLNSDVVVFNDWIDRLIYHASEDRVATVTPLSNNATIFSYPIMNFNNRIHLEASPSEIDLYAKECNRGLSNEVPTGVGFCFYMKRAVIDVIGTLDAEVFGRGYGEENDYCLRASLAGYANLQANDIFVYHYGGASFGDTYKKNEEEILRKLDLKHPIYRSLVMKHVAADPAKSFRRRLDWYRFSQLYRNRAAVLFSHPNGGGIETHIQHLTQGLVKQGLFVITIYTSDFSSQIKISSPNDEDARTDLIGEINFKRDMSLFKEFMSWLNPRFVHIHSFAGMDWNCACCLMEILESGVTPYYFTLHDYGVLCHRNNLVTPTGKYCGVGNSKDCRHCIGIDNSENFIPDPVVRRERYEIFLAKASRVIAPSTDVLNRVSRYIKVENGYVVPHEERLIFDVAEGNGGPPATDKKVCIAIIGAIGPHKGSYLLHALSSDAKLRNLPISYEIIGYSNISAELARNGVYETGPYTDEHEALEILVNKKPDLAFFPSIWPETYCYSLSLALAASIMPLVFDFGAQADRLKEEAVGLFLSPMLVDRPREINDYILSLDLVAIKAINIEYRASFILDYLGELYGLKI